MTIENLIQLISASPQHRHIYHFTDAANLPSIMEHGLLSKEQMRSQGLWPPKAPGGNQLSWDLDIYRGIDPFVSLCMTRNHGMKFLAEKDGRLPNPRYLGINPSVLAIPGVKISLGVANSNDAVILDAAEAIEHLDLEVLYSRTNWRDPDIQRRLRVAEKFEILVPNSVPKSLIVRLF